MLLHIIGSTIKNDINTAKLLDLIHTKASIIKDATGVAFIMLIIGLTTSPNTGLIYVTKANSTPIITAKIKPSVIWKIELNNEIQKLFICINCMSLKNTSTGDTIKSS